MILALIRPAKLLWLALVALAVIGVVLMVAGANVAHAATDTPSVAATDTHLDPWVVAILSGTLIPILTGALTKVTASSATKAIINALLVAAVAVVNAIVNTSGAFLLRDIIVLGVTTFVTAVATYFGFWRPALGPNAIAPTKGIG